MIRGEKIYLRPMRRSDVGYLSERVNDPAYEGEYNFFGLVSDEQMEQRFGRDGYLTDFYGRLVVLNMEDESVGMVDYRRVQYGPNEGSNVFSLGIALEPEHRGKGYGTEAHELLARYLFATFTIMRVEASTDVENVAEQRTLEKAGFIREGVLRQAQWRNGGWHDLILYSLLRSDKKK